MKKNIQILSAASILGLKPTGVEKLAETLLAAGLLQSLKCTTPVVTVPTLNNHYSFERDKASNCLNTSAIQKFSHSLSQYIAHQLSANKFPLVLGGDCSILLGITPALKKKGRFGLIFLDAHADFYQPQKSTTGEVADMDLAIVTGHGPEALTNMEGLKPYIREEDVIHIGQRDEEEAKKYGSQEIRNSLISVYDLHYLKNKGLEVVIAEVMRQINILNIEGFWIHFDTDVLSDDDNPAVDYRLPGGMLFKEVEVLLKELLYQEKACGMSVTIFNPTLDKDGTIANRIVDCLGNAFRQ